MKTQYRNLALAFSAALVLGWSGGAMAQTTPTPSTEQPSQTVRTETPKVDTAKEAPQRLMTVSDHDLKVRERSETRPRGESRTVEAKPSLDKPLLEIKGF